MTLISAWKDSLRVLTLQGLKELALATWYTIKEVFWALWTPWFIALVLIAYAIELAKIPYIDSFFFDPLFLTIIFFAALPTAQIKDFNYFVNHFRKYGWVLLKLMFLVDLVFFIFGLITAGFVRGKKIGLLLALEAGSITDVKSTIIMLWG